MKMKKYLATVLCGCMGAMAITACSVPAAAPAPAAEPAAEPAAAEAAPAEDSAAQATEAAEAADLGECEIHYAFWQDALTPYLNECKDAFEAAHPGVTIVLEPTAWGEYWTKLETAATGGSAADVFQLNGPNANKYAEAGVALCLDDYLANSDIDMSKIPASLVSLYEYDGGQYGIPMDWDTIGLWYNKELFDAAGLAYPTDSWTWDDLVAAAKALTDPEKGIYGIDAGYADQGGFYNTVYANGGYIVNDDKTKSGFSEQATIDGIKCWITDLMEPGYSPSNDSLTENPGYVQFMSGKIGMICAGDWFASTFADPAAGFADKCDVAFLPTIGGKRATVIHGKANCVNASSPNVDAAWAWVEYLASDAANEALGKTGAAIPSNLDYSGLFFEQYPQYNMQIFLDEADQCAYPYPASITSAEWGDIIWNKLVPAYSLEVPVEDACAEIAEEMDALLASEH